MIEASPKQKPAKITVTLDDQTRPDDGSPLDVLFEQTLRVLCPSGGYDARSRQWFARNALRAVCEAVIEQGCMPARLAVTLHHRQDRITRRKVVTRAECRTFSNVIPFPSQKQREEA